MVENRARLLSRTSETRSKIGGWPVAAAVAVILVFLFFIRRILPPFVLAAALAFILTPVIESLHRRLRVPRGVVAVAIYVITLAVFSALLYFIVRPVAHDVAGLARALPHNVRILAGKLNGPAGQLIGQPIDADAVANAVTATAQRVLDGEPASAVRYGVAAISGGILFFVLLCYFLVSGQAVMDGVVWLVPPEYRPEVEYLRAKTLPLLWRYFVGLLVVVAYTSLVAWLGFSLVFHLPRAGLIAVAVGLLELIPVIGPAGSIALVVLTAIQQTTLAEIAGLIAFAVALRISIDQVLGPLVLGRATRVHPVVVIFSLLSGAILFGVIGLILAVPVAASVKIALGTYYAEPVADG